MINNSDVVSVNKCSECGSSSLLRDTKSAELVCENCGFVVHARLTDSGPEWRAFTPEERKRKLRVGAPQTYMLHDKGLSTKIDWRDIRSYAPEKRAQLHRIRHWQQRSRISSSTEKSLAFALSEINRISDMLNIPRNIIETSAITYRKAVSEELIRGRSIKGMAAAIIYLACRQNKIIRTISEISRVTEIKRKEIASNYRLLVRKLKIFVPFVKPNQIITKLCNQLGLNGKTEGFAHKILLGARKQNLTSGRGAKSIAAAACYIASRISGDYRTQREVADVADLTEVTIRNRYKEMMRQLKIIIIY